MMVPSLRDRLPLTLLALLLTGCFGATDGGSEEPPGNARGADVPSYGPASPPGTYAFEGSYSKVLQPGVLGILPLEKTYVPSALDGVDIEIGVWRPDTPEAERVPVLVDAGPYYGSMGSPLEEPGRHLRMLTSNFVPHGYAVAGVSVRGTGDSGGCMDLMGPIEVADLSQAITWLAEQPWSNGNVGMIGKSYDGSTPWMVASTGNPHLKTIVPVSGVPDVYELMFRNGTSELRGSFLLNALYYGFVVRESAPPPEDAADAERIGEHTLEGAACPDHAVGMGAALYAGFYGERDPTGYWAERNLKPRVEENYRGSILLVQGLQDWNVDPGLSLPWADDLNQSGLFVHQMLGQWGHRHPDENDGPNQRWDWAEILLHWFDYWLKGDTTRALGPPVQVLDNQGRWRVDDAWPPRDAAWLSLHLAEGEALAGEPGAAGSVQLVPNVPGPNAPAAPDTLPMHLADFLTPPLESELLISGLPKLDVTITPQGPAGHLAAWLYDVDPEGGETRIGWSMLNLMFNDGATEATPLTPGDPVVARMEVQPMDASVAAGHQLLLRVWQYRDDPPNDQAQGRQWPVTAPLTLEYGGTFESVLRIPVIERGPDAYFVPPSSE